MSTCSHCISGTAHQGHPIGRIEKIGGYDTYTIKPSGEYHKDKAVLLLPDIFGIQFKNCKLLADDFARGGFQIYAPDYFEGDPVPDGALNDPKFDLGEWRKKHGPEVTRPILDSVIAALQSQGVKKFAAVGYCFGGRYVFDLAFDNAIQVAATAHPSFLQVPQDLETFKSRSKAPLLINGAEVDQQYPPESQAIGDQILGDGKHTPGYQRIFWPGTTHGFAVRGDLNDPKVKAAKNGAFKATLEFFLKYLYDSKSSARL